MSGEQGCVRPCGHREWGEATAVTPTLPGGTLGPGPAAPSLLQDRSTAASAELGAVGLCLAESPPPSRGVIWNSIPSGRKWESWIKERYSSGVKGITVTALDSERDSSLEEDRA